MRPGPGSTSRPSRSTAVLALQARALAHADFEVAAAEVVNQLSTQLGCERVSLGLYVGGRLRVVAVAGVSDLNPRSAEVQRLAAAMAEALDQRLALVHPMPAGATPAITVAHAALAASNGQAAIFTVPVSTRHEMMGALLYERQGGFDPGACETAKDAAMFVGPLLTLKHRAESGLRRTVGRALLADKTRRPFSGTRRATLRAAALGSLVLVGALALMPVTQHVVSPARVEGRVQQVLAAPVDGFVGSVAVRPGELVKAGQVLLVLDTRELELERDKWAAEMSQLDKQYREAMSREEAAPIVMARARLDVARSQHELALQQIQRATLRAPIDGVVMSGDFTQSVGVPLKRGQELMTLAPDQGWRIVAEVDEQEVSLVHEGQQAQALFAALGGRGDLKLAITRIAPVATQAEGRNVFEVEGTPSNTALAGSGTTLRAGMRGVMRIEAGQRALAVLWWERGQRAWRRLAWHLRG